jgi:hypothetical protein
MAGLSSIDAGKLEWAEKLASTKKCCPENPEVLLRCAKVYLPRNEVHLAVWLANSVGKLANTGSGQHNSRAYDLMGVSRITSSRQKDSGR